VQIIHIDSDNNVIFGTMIGIEKLPGNHAIKMVIDETGETVVCMGMILPRTDALVEILNNCMNPWEVFKAVKLCFQTIDLIRAVGLNERNQLDLTFLQRTIR
jgi:hypothetical protein